MELSTINRSVVVAYDRGYRVQINGDVVSPSGKTIKLSHTGKRKYLKFNIRAENTFRVVLVHKLQAYQKYGDRVFTEGIVVRHLNGERFDNSFVNIEIGSYQDNALDIPEKDRVQKAIKASYSKRKLTNEEINIMVDLRLNEKVSYAELGRQFKLTKSAVRWFFINKVYTQPINIVK